MEPIFFDSQYVTYGKGIADIVFCIIESFYPALAKQWSPVMLSHYYAKLNMYSGEKILFWSHFSFFVATCFGAIPNKDLIDVNFPFFSCNALWRSWKTAAKLFRVSRWHAKYGEQSYPGIWISIHRCVDDSKQPNLYPRYDLCISAYSSPWDISTVCAIKVLFHSYAIEILSFLKDDEDEPGLRGKRGPQKSRRYLGDQQPCWWHYPSKLSGHIDIFRGSVLCIILAILRKKFKCKP